ncbi:MAG: ABC transporter ATP-binding protein [Alphaproteobacteria bacterium]|nr:ABC transporter ATP-binding protein [Alphaproteobacteria bacterium]
MSDLLTVTDLHAGYGEVRVLHGVSLNVAAGGITAIIGSNGAGKSTLMRSLSGMIEPSSGSILFEGRSIGGMPSDRVVADGITMVPEGRWIFPDMTVMENLRVGAIAPRGRAVQADTLETVLEMFPRLRERTHQAGGTLSGGEQQMLALGRGLMAAPKVLLLDEPTLGLAPGIAKLIFRILPDLVRLGLTVVLAEQNVSQTLAIADHAYVLENGRIVLEGTGSDLLGSEQVRAAYLGH